MRGHIRPVDNAAGGGRKTADAGIDKSCKSNGVRVIVQELQTTPEAASAAVRAIISKITGRATIEDKPARQITSRRRI